MKGGYLEITDPDAILDLEKYTPEQFKSRYEDGYTEECPACKGYGGWHLKINAYGPGRHFNCSCMQCNGFGYVKLEDAEHPHEWDSGTRIGNCLHEYKCLVEGCTRKRVLDSSD
jgi:hypothetical protein